MADSPTGEKTEQPTQKKLDDARKKGDIATSKEISSVAIFLSFSLMITWIIEGMYTRLEKHINLIINSIPNREYDIIPMAVKSELFTIAYTLMPPLLITFLIIVFIKYLEVGPVFTFEPFKMDISKLAFKGYKNVVSSKNLMSWLISLAKLAIFMTIYYFVISKFFPDIYRSQNCGLKCELALWGHIVFYIISFFLVASIIIAIFDYSLQARIYKKKQMMSLYDIKKEFKTTQGDPLIKGQRKSFHMEILRGPAKKNVSKSSVLITNPNHIAIGLRYELGQKTLPIVTLVEKDYQALYAKRYAQAYDIPVVENIELARSMLHKVSINRYIPAEFIDPVIEVLSWVYGFTIKDDAEVNSVGANQKGPYF